MRIKGSFFQRPELKIMTHCVIRGGLMGTLRVCLLALGFLTAASAQAGVRLVFEDPELPVRLPALPRAAFVDYLESYRQDWADDEARYAQERVFFCRGVPAEAKARSLPSGRALLQAAEMLRDLPGQSRLMDPRGLQAPLISRLRAAVQAQGLNPQERLELARLGDRVAHDRGELYELAIESQWLLVRAAARQYREATEQEAVRGGQTRSNFRGGNAATCSALALRSERNASLSALTRLIETARARLAADRGE